MEKWFIRNRPGDMDRISEEFNIPKFTSKLLINRDLLDRRSIDSFISPSLDKLHNPALMKDLRGAAEFLLEEIQSEKRIRIIGDYDVDGVISTYMLYSAIEGLGGKVDYSIPNRVEDGYGINKDMINQAKSDGIDTIITCDNGISAIEEMKYARKLDIRTIVTDHHDLPFKLVDGERVDIYVDADFIVNPKRSDCEYPFELLCGAGVVYKLLEEVYSLLDRASEVENLLEFAAIATICDVVDLLDENRIIVKEGLERLNNTNNKGLLALIEETGLKDKEIGVYHVGFVIGPCINASGRLDTAEKAIEMLISQDDERVKILARELKTLNDERKEMTEAGTESIIEQIESTSLKEDSVLLIYEPEIHESIAGIIAGRIKDRYHKPTIVLTRGLEGVKGSARSIESYNMFEELTERKEFLTRFGGHPMAAGLSMKEDDIEDFRKSLNKNNLTEDDLIPRIYIDLPLSIDHIDYRLIREIDRLAPYGKGNSRPLFGDKNLRLLNGMVLGKNKNVLKLTLVSETGTTIEGMIFNGVEDFEELISGHYGRHELENLYNGLGNNILLDIIYYPSVNEFRGKTKLQSIIQSYRIGS